MVDVVVEAGVGCEGEDIGEVCVGIVDSALVCMSESTSAMADD